VNMVNTLTRKVHGYFETWVSSAATAEQFTTKM
jgi:hypothetical protein